MLTVRKTFTITIYVKVAKYIYIGGDIKVIAGIMTINQKIIQR